MKLSGALSRVASKSQRVYWASHVHVIAGPPVFRRSIATLQEKHLAAIAFSKAVKGGDKTQKQQPPAHAVLSAFDLFSIGVGPSSSHTLGPWRAARIFIQSLRDVGLFSDVFTLKIDLYGSLAATGKGHASPEAILMGMKDLDPETCDTDLVQPHYKEIQDTKTLILGGTRQIQFHLERDMIYHFNKSLPRHPNGMTFSVFSREGDLLATNTYFSIGGGFVVNAAAAEGNENLYYKQTKKEEASPTRRRPKQDPSASLSISDGAKTSSSTSTPKKVISDPPLLFWSASDLLDICRNTNRTIAQVVWENERHYLSDEEIRAKLLKLWSVMDESIHKGVTSTEMYLPGRLRVKRRAANLYQKLARGLYPSNYKRTMGGDLTSVDAQRDLVVGRTDHPLSPVKPRRVNFPTMDILACYAIAVNEMNAAGSRIVVAPTNGAAGIIPAVLKYLLEFISEDQERDIQTFLLTASAVGSLFKRGATISAAEGGCQAEVGVACSMAAAGFAACLGGSPEVIEHAAEIGIEHNLGLTCDPIDGLVQVPCILARERNALGAVKAVTSASLALTEGEGYHSVSLDQAIAAMRETAIMMREELKQVFF